MIGPFEEVSRLDDDMYHETFYADDARRGGLTLNGRHPGLLHELVLFRSIFFPKRIFIVQKVLNWWRPLSHCLTL